MTELELFKQAAPDIAKIIFGLQKMEPDQQESFEKEWLEYASGLNAFVYEFIRKTLVMIDEYLTREEEKQEMKIDDIKIFPCFAAHPPKVEKMQQKEQYFTETGLLQSEIVLDSCDNLIDGYTSYLLAVKHGIQCVPVRYGKRQVIKALHKPGGKPYMWGLPKHLIDRVSAGDKVLVHTTAGIRTVTVAAVEEYAGQEPKLLRMVIRVKGTQGNVKAVTGGYNGQDAV